MNLEDFREFCLSLPGAKENSPWTVRQYQSLVTFTVNDKWFCLLDLENKFCDVKCDPSQIVELQDKYTGIQPAWHMNKKHWIKIVLDSDDDADTIKTLVAQSYHLVA